MVKAFVILLIKCSEGRKKLRVIYGDKLKRGHEFIDRPSVF